MKKPPEAANQTASMMQRGTTSNAGIAAFKCISGRERLVAILVDHVVAANLRVVLADVFSSNVEPPISIVRRSNPRTTRCLATLRVCEIDVALDLRDLQRHTCLWHWYFGISTLPSTRSSVRSSIPFSFALSRVE